jgi:hypothetical protein
MSSSKLSFSIAVKLLTDNFKKGSASVKSYLRSMQMQFMSFAAAVGGGAIGLSNFVSKMIETEGDLARQYRPEKCFQIDRGICGPPEVHHRTVEEIRRAGELPDKWVCQVQGRG